MAGSAFIGVRLSVFGRPRHLLASAIGLFILADGFG